MKNIELLPPELTCWKRCEQCGRDYVEVDNIGRFLCAVHPGVKLVNSNGQSYFSCCNRINTRDGCTRLDHTTERFTYQSIDERFNQIQAFSILILPNLLIPYLYGPLIKDRVLFSLPSDFSPSRNTDDIMAFKLPVLEEGMRRYRKKLVYDKNSMIDQAPQDDEPNLYDGLIDEDELKWVEETLFSKKQILASLLENSSQSELFQKELSAQESKKMRGEKECEQIWKNISSSGSKSGDKNKSNIIINFMVISRIDRVIQQ